MMQAYCSIPGLDEFLSEHPFISIKPSRCDDTILEGEFRFNAQHPGFSAIADAYTVRITVPKSFPDALPKFQEIAGRIPQNGDYHVNKGDGTLCLGSPLRLMIKLREEPTLAAFSRNCLIPYLYAMSARLQGQPFIFGELQHGIDGQIDDYCSLFVLKSPDQVIDTIKCILKKKRVANKFRCPCKCGNRLGKCRHNERVRKYRQLVPKTWLNELLVQLNNTPSSSKAICS